MEDTEDTKLPTMTQAVAYAEKAVRRTSHFKTYQDNQGELLEQTRGSFLVAATVMATLTFQIAVNPPGGVWQSDSQTQQDCAADPKCKAGTSVLAASGDRDLKLKYEAFILLCTISFSAAQTAILILICGFSLRNRLVMWLLLIAMCISVIGTAGAYVVSIWMNMLPHNHTVYRSSLYYAFVWAGLASLLCLGLFSRVMFMLLRKFLRFFIPLLRRFSRYLCDVNE